MAEDLRPQAGIETVKGDDRVAHANAYTDPALTTRQVTNDDAPESYDPPKSGPTTQGGVTVYEKEGTDHEPGDQGATPVPHAGNNWKPGRDLYANNGSVGQNPFKHHSQQ